MLLLLELLLELDNNQRERKKERQRGTVPKRKKGTIVRRTRRWLLVAAAPIRSLRLFLPPFVVFGHDFFMSCRGQHPPNTARRSPKRDSNKYTTKHARKHTTKHANKHANKHATTGTGTNPNKESGETVGIKGFWGDIVDRFVVSEP